VSDERSKGKLVERPDQELGERIDDPVVRWVAEQPGALIWERPAATAVACADLSRKDRLAIHGEPEAVAALLRDEVLPRVGPTFRPLGGEELVTEVAARVPGMAVAGRFGWMQVTAPVPGPATDASWLPPEALPQVTALIDKVFPDSYARPGGSGVQRWAAIRGADGTLLSVAADAWSTERTGFLAGVATRTDVRGRGLARRVCAFVTNELIAGRDRVALIVDYWNVGALTTYGKLGFDLRRLAAASVS
jgi:ribosomal protein S18 acetylase RimI-like enzyme